MLIFRLSGGLGNQFFSFAAGYSICKDKGEVFGLDVSTQCAPWFFRDFDIDNYDIHYDKKILYRLGDEKIDHYLLNHICRRRAIGLFTPTIRERKLRQYDPDLFNFSYKTAYIIGDWQSWKYFANYEDDIRKMYVYQKKLSPDAGRLKQTLQANPSSIAVHIRRGDYVKQNSTIEDNYYIEAIRLAAEKIKNPVFYCFSEDTDWARNAFKDLPYQFVYMDYESDNKGLEDFELLRSCHHQITCNSTYSWWAAWLNDTPEKLVIHPEKKGWEGPDLWPEPWIGIRLK